MFGEMEIKNLSNRQLNNREMIHGFREYTMERTSQKLLPFIHALHSIPISSSECERGFTQMNLIITQTRASLMTKTVVTFIHKTGGASSDTIQSHEVCCIMVT